MPFAEEISAEKLGGGDVEGSATAAAAELAACYRCLSSGPGAAGGAWRHDQLRYHGRRFAKLLVALEAVDGPTPRFRVKPKLHLFFGDMRLGDRPRWLLDLQGRGPRRNRGAQRPTAAASGARGPRKPAGGE